MILSFSLPISKMNWEIYIQLIMVTVAQTYLKMFILNIPWLIFPSLGRYLRHISVCWNDLLNFEHLDYGFVVSKLGIACDPLWLNTFQAVSMYSDTMWIKSWCSVRDSAQGCKCGVGPSCSMLLISFMEESPLDFKEIRPVHAKRSQSWIFIAADRGTQRQPEAGRGSMDCPLGPERERTPAYTRVVGSWRPGSESRHAVISGPRFVAVCCSSPGKLTRQPFWDAVRSVFSSAGWSLPSQAYETCCPQPERPMLSAGLAETIYYHLFRLKISNVLENKFLKKIRFMGQQCIL